MDESVMLIAAFVILLLLIVAVSGFGLTVKNERHVTELTSPKKIDPNFRSGFSSTQTQIVKPYRIPIVIDLDIPRDDDENFFRIRDAWSSAGDRFTNNFIKTLDP